MDEEKIVCILGSFPWYIRRLLYRYMICGLVELYFARGEGRGGEGRFFCSLAINIGAGYPDVSNFCGIGTAAYFFWVDTRKCGREVFEL